MITPQQSQVSGTLPKARKAPPTALDLSGSLPAGHMKSRVTTDTLAESECGMTAGADLRDEELDTHGEPGPRTLASRVLHASSSSGRNEGQSSTRLGRSATMHRSGSGHGHNPTDQSGSPERPRLDRSRRRSSDQPPSSPPLPSPRSPGGPGVQFLDPETTSRMRRYVEEIVTCNFDLDRGPVVERRMLGRKWGKGEKANVAFSAFPDAGLFQEGHIGYSFKIRDTGPGALSDDAARSHNVSSKSETPLRRNSTLLEPHAQTRSISPGPLTPPMKQQPFFGLGSEGPETPMAERPSFTRTEVADDYRLWDRKTGREWLYGFVWFEQRRDTTISRGYMQRSVVILSRLPFPALFNSVLEALAPVYFEDGYSAFQAACKAIARWPDPVPGKELRLMVNDRVLRVRLPDGHDTAQLHVARDQPRFTGEDRLLLASLPSLAPLRAFSAFLPSLWHVWECAMLNESLLVIAPDPKQCSDIVWWIRDLLRPIPSSNADFRPYLHIHDLDFRLFVTSEKPPPGLIIGVTNPFFRDAAGHWPNVINVASATPAKKANGTAASGAPTPADFISKRKRHVSKDRALLKRLETLVSQGKYDDPDGNVTLRSHFMQLTEKMLSPINRYLSSLIPPARSIEPVKPFSLPDFLAHLKATAPNPLHFRPQGLLPKGKVEIEFYTKFCSTPGFAEWQTQQLASLGSARGDMRSAAVSELFSRDRMQFGQIRRTIDVDQASSRSSLSSQDTASPNLGRQQVAKMPAINQLHLNSDTT